MSSFALDPVSALGLESALIVEGESSALPTESEIRKFELPSKGSVVERNYSRVGPPLDIRDNRFEILQHPYAVRLIDRIAESPDRTKSADVGSIVWLTRDLEEIPCSNALQPGGVGKCHKELVLDTMNLPVEKEGTGIEIVFPRPIDNPCTWHGTQVLASVTAVNEASPRTPRTVVAAWLIDLSNERFISIPPSEVDCSVRNAVLERYLNFSDFLASGYPGDFSHGLDGIRRIAKVLREDISYASVPYPDKSIKEEIHRIEFNGMTVTANVQRNAARDWMYVSEIRITGAKWPVKYDLGVGAPRRKIEETLGETQSKEPREWSVADTPGSVTFTFGADDKVESITWQKGNATAD